MCFQQDAKEYVKADIRDRDQVNQVVDGCDYIIHLAAHPLSTSLENPKLNIEVNIGGTLNILDAAREYSN